MKFYKKNFGITLIALVVTIIVLLILAGISISMLTGQNGILNRAAEAKEKTEDANKEEQRKLAQAEALMSTEDTVYNGIKIPKGFAPTKIEGEDSIDVGLVITDGSGNEYVWVEVPKTIYTDSNYNTSGTPNSENDWEKIRDCLKSYTRNYSSSDYKDTNADGVTYSDDYKKMLKSVYENGGFWIGRYEVGIENGKNPRTFYIEIKDDDRAVVKANMYPYNYITRDEAQILATRMNYNECTSSLIYGLQWDLVLKYTETKGAATNVNLTTDSTKIGNYYNSELKLNRGKFAQYGELSNWFDYNSEKKKELVTGSKKKVQDSYSNAMLLTTGATEDTTLQNIYDIAGNVWEWTLEMSDTIGPCVARGGCYRDSGLSKTIKERGADNTINSYDYLGFRIGLWK